MQKQINVQVGSRVQHRAWFWFATVTELPDPTSWSSHVKLQIDGRTEQGTFPVFSLIYDPMDFIYDWSEPNETPRRRAKSKGKKSKHKR